uniref:Large ribosomal subunit protein mL54 n=1 Tax=Ceriodaphnia reticulata TaxID=302197 RepID=A0A4Y7LY86_9CRUS|nr:EOG090X0KWJ [Ceriodaphnia reticulata]SVE73336.1 EOG090X0KWJ [Ceriodaphnia reticulata]
MAGAMSWGKLSICAKLLRSTTTWNVQRIAEYAKPAGGPGGLGSKKAGKLGKLGPVVEKKILPVETDPEKLVNYVCGSNILKQGQDIQLKPDSEYPDWLWSLRLGKVPPLEEMDQNTLQYWRRLRKLNLRRQSRLMELRRY